MKEKFDFEGLKSRIEFATRKCFGENMEQHGANLCAFALASDDGAMTVVPRINTIGHLEKMQQQDAQYKDDYEFSSDEWFSDDGANVEFDDICRILANEIAKDGLDFVSFKKELFDSCVQVLEKLRGEQFFPEDLLVLFSISDTFESVENQVKWAKRLNPGEKAVRFEHWLTDSF